MKEYINNREDAMALKAVYEKKKDIPGESFYENY